MFCPGAEHCFNMSVVWNTSFVIKKAEENGHQAAADVLEVAAEGRGERSEFDSIWTDLQFLVWGGPSSSLMRAKRAALREMPLIPSPHSFSAL